MERAKAIRNRNPAPLGLTETDINVGLLRRRVKKKDIARMCTVSQSAVSQVIKGKMRSQKIEECLKLVILGEEAA